ncbi:MAG: hypothetical protein K2Z80_08165 [Xanthobacteraceae bacterium]|nr:hypothetical protein [Xanthobacteraceae bacterium]
MMLALNTKHVSEVVFSLLTSQRLWCGEKNRRFQDITGGMTSLIGFDGRTDKEHVDAVKRGNERPARRTPLAWLVPLFLFTDEFGERTKVAIGNFKVHLPFEFQEQRNDGTLIAQLSEQAAEWAELAEPDNYRARKHQDQDDMVEIIHVSPSASKPENIAKTEKATITLQEHNLWGWASKIFDDGRVDNESSVDGAIQLARKLDGPELDGAGDHEDNFGMRRGAVAATAAVILRFRNTRSSKDVEWAREALKRAFAAPESRGQFWSPESVIPWHHAIYVARGLAADVRQGTADPTTPAMLFALVAHPLDCVSLAAIKEALALWDVDPKLAWTALHLSLLLCHVEPDPKRRGFSDPIHSEAHIRKALKGALRDYGRTKEWPGLPAPPPAWIKTQATKGKQRAKPDDVDYDYEDGVPGDGWTRPRIYWRSKHADHLLDELPFEIALKSPAAPELLKFIEAALKWTIEKIDPPWAKDAQQRERHASEDYEWVHGFGTIIGHLVCLMPIDQAKKLFVDPILALDDEPCWSLLNSLASAVVCRYVYDAATVPDGAIDILSACLDRFLAAGEFRKSSYRAGELSGFDQPRLAETLMFVSVERAALAARFVNGDWSQIGLILPLVDRYVRAVGWSGTVMADFLKLCERSKENYPSELFADQILSVLEGDGFDKLRGWHGTFLPARIASLVQHFSVRDTPMPVVLGQKLLRTLDVLVDMGDRRSAALQLSESFREVRLV